MKGYSYGGDTNNDSKACADNENKKIYIGKGKSSAEALLSLTYELLNANNSSKINKVNDKYLSDKIPDKNRAREYAKQILLIEAEAVNARSNITIKLGLESLIKNPKYLQFAKDPNIKNGIKRIHEEMANNGTVHNGKIKALDHYMNAYLERVNLNYLQFGLALLQFCQTQHA